MPHAMREKFGAHVYCAAAQCYAGSHYASLCYTDLCYAGSRCTGYTGFLLDRFALYSFALQVYIGFLRISDLRHTLLSLCGSCKSAVYWLDMSATSAFGWNSCSISEKASPSQLLKHPMNGSWGFRKRSIVSQMGALVLRTLNELFAFF